MPTTTPPQDAIESLPESRLLLGMMDELHQLASSGTGSKELVGKRMLETRKSWGLTQAEAATQLGYASGTHLSLIETGTKDAPLATLAAAARLYCVSADYLIGLVDEPEQDPKLRRSGAVTRRLHHALQAAAEVLADLVDKSATPPEVSSHLQRLVKVTDRLTSAFRRFEHLNRARFERMAGGAPVVSAANEAESVIAEALEFMESDEDALPTPDTHKICSVWAEIIGNSGKKTPTNGALSAKTAYQW